MKALEPLTEPWLISEYSDIARIGKVCFSKGFYISDLNAYLVWQKYCDDYSASWLSLPDSDDELFKIITSYCLETEDA